MFFAPCTVYGTEKHANCRQKSLFAVKCRLLPSATWILIFETITLPPQIVAGVFCYWLGFVSRRAGIMPMGVRRLNSAVFPVDYHFRSLMPADDPSCINGLPFCSVVATYTSASTAFDIPASVCCRNNVMRLSCHVYSPFNLIR